MADSTDSTSHTDSGGGSAGRKVLVALAVIAVVALLWWGGRQLTPYVERFSEWVDGQGALGPVFFILGYAVATVCFVPGAALTLAGGFVFGLLWGTVYVFIGATLGACLAFLIARYLARGGVEEKLADRPDFAKVDRAVGKEGGKIVALLRLSPLFPFVFLNYALGLTSVRFLPYLLACFAMLPGTFLYVYYGHVGRAVTGGGERTKWDWIALGVGLVATLVATWIITKKAQAALNESGDFEEAEDE